MGKRFFLRLAADIIREVNMVRDKDGVSFARKAMLQFVWASKWSMENFAIEAGASRNNLRE